MQPPSHPGCGLRACCARHTHAMPAGARGAVQRSMQPTRQLLPALSRKPAAGACPAFESRGHQRHASAACREPRLVGRPPAFTSRRMRMRACCHAPRRTVRSLLAAATARRLRTCAAPLLTAQLPLVAPAAHRSAQPAGARASQHAHRGAPWGRVVPPTCGASAHARRHAYTCTYVCLCVYGCAGTRSSTPRAGSRSSLTRWATPPAYWH